MTDDQTIDRNEMRSRRLEADPFATISISGGDPVQVFGLVTIGRDPKPAAGSVIVVDGDPLVSKSHLALDRQSGEIVITDLGSSNGTFLHHSGQETPVPTDRWIVVPHGADVEFGDQRMTIQAADRRAAASATPPAAANSPSDFADHDSTVAAEACVRCARPLELDARFCDVCGTSTTSAEPVNVFTQSALQGSGYLERQLPPGDANAPGFVDPPSAGRVRRSPAKKIVAALAVLVALGPAAFVLTRVLAGDDSDASGDGGLPVLPLKLDEQWSESVRGNVFGVGIGQSSVLVASDPTSDGFTLTSFASEDGDEQWDVAVPTAEPYFAGLVGEYVDIIVFQACGESCVVVGIDRLTGEIEWDQNSAGFASAGDVDGRLLLFDDDSVELLDPSDGSRLERIRGDSIELSIGSTFVVRDGDEVEVFDPDLTSVFGPVDIDTDTSAVAYTGSQLVAAVGDELQFLDEDGDVVAESNLDDAGVVSINHIADDNLIIETGDGVMSVDPVDGNAVVRWSQEGLSRNMISLDDGGGVLVIIEDLDGPDAEVVDADTGDRRFRIDALVGADQSVITLPGSAGLLLITEDFDEDDLEAQALDWADGEEIWSERFAGQVAFGEGVLVEYTVGGDVALYR